MKYKFCSIRINVTEYDVKIATKGGLNLLPPWLYHCATIIVCLVDTKILEYKM